MEIKKWLGLKNTTAPERLAPGELAIAQNVDIDNAAKLLARVGQTSVSGSSYHSLWATPHLCLIMQGQDLKRVFEDGSMVTLTRLTSGRPVSFSELNGVVYFSNGTDTGRIVGGVVKEWGIKRPISQPSAAPYPGSLPAGRYLYAMTFVRNDGLESGTGPSGAIELALPGGILFTGLEISTNPEVSGKMLYLSHANGTKLYRAAILSKTAASHAYMNGGSDLTAVLDTVLVEPAPAGHIVEILNGIAYVADGNVAWYSDPYSVERFRRATSFLQFPGRIQIFGGVGDGIYVATESGTWFLEGNGPANFVSRQVLSYGAIEGTAVKFDGEELNSEGESTGVAKPGLMWVSKYGTIVGLNTGQVRNISENKYGFPDAQRGAALLKTARGYTQYVATLQGTGQSPNIYE